MDCHPQARGCRIGRVPLRNSRRRVLVGVDLSPGDASVPGRPPAFGVYIHWPFCLSKCPYCDFNSHVRHDAIDEDRFLRAFLAEIAATAARVPARTVTS